MIRRLLAAYQALEQRLPARPPQAVRARREELPGAAAGNGMAATLAVPDATGPG